MKRFPLRLWAALAKGRLLRAPRGVPRNSPIRYVRPEELLHSQGSQPVSHQAVHSVLRDRNSIVWIGGSEPLAHAGIGHLTRLILQSGHFLFLETNGVSLRQRIHEFQPGPRFYLVIRFLGGEAEHDRRCGHRGAFRAALEGIRAAQLSGFLICAYLDVPSESDSTEWTEFCAELSKWKLDGILVCPPVASGNARFLSSVLIPAWVRFSRLVESAASVNSAGPTLQAGRAPAGSTSDRNCEEGMHA